VQTEANNEGLIAVQQPDGSFKHITREEWEELNQGGAENGESEGVEE